MGTPDVMEARIKVDSPELVRLRADEMSQVLQKETQGLVIPDERKGESILWPEEGNTISYVHKTAHDFLADSNARKKLGNKLSRSSFHPQLALLRAMIMQL